MSKSQNAADDLAIADLTGTLTETPVNTPAVVEPEAATDPTPDPVVEAETPDTSLIQKPEAPSDTYEKRYKDLQREFTKRTEREKALEGENAQFRNWYNQYQAWYQQQQQPAQPQEDPDTIPTVQRVHEMVATIVDKKEKAILEAADRKIAAAKVEEYKFQYAQEVGKYAQDLVTAEPLLAAEAVDPEDTSLYENMVKYAQNKLFGPNADPDLPRDITAFKAQMKAYADKKATGLKKLINNHEQAAIAKATKANKPGIAAPGGSIPAVQKADKAPKFGTPAFRDYLAQGLEEEQQVVNARKK
jgi:hypothetical protein